LREKMKKMNTYLKDLKTIAGRFGFFLFESLRVILHFVAEFNLKVRIAALLVLTGLLMPMIFVGGWQTATAASVALPAPAPVSAPPEPFVLSSSNTVSTALISSAVSVSTFVAGGYDSAAGFFTTPELPAGLSTELAKPISPFAAFVSLAASSVGMFLGSAAPSSKAAAAAPLNPTPYAPGSVKFDYDGDGRADAARFQPSTGQWKVRSSINNAFTTDAVGTGSSVIAPADYDGDGRTDYAVFNAGSWTIKYANGATATATGFGQSGDKPVAGDYDGDGRADLAVWRSSNATWTIRQSASGNQPISYQFGASSDIPVPGNYDGDARMDLAVYRPSTGNWFVQGSQSGFASAQWGNSTDIPVPADYDGDGRTDYAVYRANAGTWYVNYSNGSPYSTIAWGNYGDQPVAADYDGDGKADIAVWRPTNGVWYISKSQNGAFESFVLGAPGDVAVESAYYKQIGGEVYSYDFARTRLSPKNATGGTNLYSRNFSWGTELVNLPGRAGLDAGLGISYNSLIWTKEGSTMVFDADSSSVSPGFRFGFPVIESAYLDSATGRFNYLMVTPSGAKVEFRQTAASNIYETADSSYAQLKIYGSADPNVPPSDLTITVTGTDGTQMSYAWIGNAYRCTQIKDSNGNYITVEHNEYGLLRYITDTLGRVITVNYDSDSNPVNVTQNWQTDNGSGGAAQHTYATFNYTSQPVNPNFGSGIAVYGPQGVNVKLLQSIVYADGSSTRFDYNSYGQVYKVSNIAADNHVLNHTKVNLSNGDLSASQADCPRFSETRNYVENFNNGNETIVGNTITENSTYSVGGMSGAATKIEVSMTGEPNNHVSRTYVGASGWMEGLPVATEDLANENGSYGQRRWTRTFWTQDNMSLSYILNPRVTESKVGDASNVKKTTIDYVSQSGITLPSEVKVYDTNQSTVLKSSLTEYKWDAAYMSRRIIGLPVRSEARGLNQSNNQFELVSKITYVYDGGNFTGDATVNQNISSVIYHDNTNYGAGFITGRGNPTSTTRWNVGYPDSASEAVTSSVLYNTAGAPVKQITPGSTANTVREVKIDYTDVFSDGYNRNTFAYPTKITDPADNFSEVKYRYDIGANVRAKSPAPAGNTRGKETTRTFDSLGRLEEQTIVNSGAYTRYARPNPDDGTQIKVFTTVTAGAGEAVTETYSDGAGRVRANRSELPGSAVRWSGTLVEYDILGQVKRQSVPTEIDDNWKPAGDDLNRGWLWTQQKYDWKGRVTRRINTDGADSLTLNDSDTLISYDGCGCAGGQITTVQGELVPRDDQPNLSARRTQKAYDDVQGRTVKTEVMNWDGTTPYTTTVNTFNGRDQVTSSIQYAGAAGVNSPHQDATMSYDGHGRIKTQHRPEQDANAVTVYNYNADDSISSVVDARGANVNYTYNSRGLVEQISSASGSNIPIAPTVAFIYDNIGNRISMTDGLGSVSYAYNQLSQMTSETRQFNDVLANAPLTNNSFKLEYDYTLSGQLKSLKDPYGQQFNYAYDKVGRLNSVAGATAFAGITTYASNPNYNARGTLTALHYGNGVEMAITGFNNKLQATDFEIKKGATSVIKKQYQFYTDGSLKFSKDVNNAMFDRLYKYDNSGRTVQSAAGSAAKGQTDDAANIPYKQNYVYNAFGNITQSSLEHYAGGQTISNYSFTNNRNAQTTSVYDAEGNQTADEGGAYQFDAAGRMIKNQKRDSNNSSQYLLPTMIYHDGAGLEAKRITSYVENGNNSYGTSYFIRSSVLGKIVSETNSTGEKLKTFVSANGATIAEQHVEQIGGQRQDFVDFLHQDASGASLRKTNKDGIVSTNESAEFDALGNNVGLSNPYVSYYEPPPPNEGAIDFGGAGYNGGGSLYNGLPGGRQYTVDGIGVSEAYFMMQIDFAMVGGAFGLLAMSARMSAAQFAGYSVRTNHGTIERNYGNDLNRAAGEALESNTMTVYRNFRINGSWSIVASLIPPALEDRVLRWGTTYAPDVEKTLPSRIDAILKDPKIQSPECTKAFEAIGATPIIDQLLASNITFVSESAFMNPANDAKWGADEDLASGLRVAANSKIQRYFGIGPQMTGEIEAADITQVGEYKGKRYIGLPNYGINQKLDHLSVTIIHALIHSGGIPGESSSGSHDLKRFGKKYDDIIEACQKNESKVKKAAS